jgi:hypothetical protein
LSPRQQKDRLEQAGLAGAALPEETKDLAPEHRERDVLERATAGTAQAQALELECGGRGLDHPRASHDNLDASSRGQRRAGARAPTSCGFAWSYQRVLTTRHPMPHTHAHRF